MNSGFIDINSVNSSKIYMPLVDSGKNFSENGITSKIFLNNFILTGKSSVKENIPKSSNKIIPCNHFENYLKNISQMNEKVNARTDNSKKSLDNRLKYPQNQSNSIINNKKLNEIGNSASKEKIRSDSKKNPFNNLSSKNFFVLAPHTEKITKDFNDFVTSKYTIDSTNGFKGHNKNLFLKPLPKLNTNNVKSQSSKLNKTKFLLNYLLIRNKNY
jgi:hypothetical protein